MLENLKSANSVMMAEERALVTALPVQRIMEAQQVNFYFNNSKVDLWAWEPRLAD